MRIPAERIPSLPTPVRAVLRNAVWTFGRLTAGARPLPDFLILGAQKAGTTALYAYLREHPAVTGPGVEGGELLRPPLPARAALVPRQLPALGRARGAAVGEASPSYLFHPLAPERVRAAIPGARLVALAAEPGRPRALPLQHEVALGRETLSFEGALEAEEERLVGEVERLTSDPAYFSHAWWNHTYASRGLYAEQLERWLEVFPREQLLVLSPTSSAADPAATYSRVLDFLGAALHGLASYPRIFEREYEPMAPATRERLEAFFVEPDRRLADVLGRPLPPGWP